MAVGAYAQTTVELWHAMAGHNGEMVQIISDQFNASQKLFKVVPVYKGSYVDTMNAGIAAFRAGQAPAIIQVYEVGTATMMAAKNAINRSTSLWLKTKLIGAPISIFRPSNPIIPLPMAE